MTQEVVRITEIFYSLQGESTRVGLPTVFVRLTGCPLRCGYCDSAYAFSGGTKMSLDDIVAKVASYKPQYVCVTGGEPLAQKGCFALLNRLCDAGYGVSLETSGAMDISAVDPRVMKVMDIKTPGSLEVDKNRWENLDHLSPNDQIKFVICNEDDYLWAAEMIQSHQLADKCEVLFSPSHEDFPLRTLADRIVQDNLPVRLQVQLHKFIWGDEKGR